MNLQHLLWIGVLAICLGGSSCAPDEPPPDEPNQLLGEWTIDRATRNGRTTETLRGMFFRFDDAQMATNMMGEELTAPYELDGAEIEHELPGFGEEFDVRELSDSSLILTTRMRGYDFEFFLKRAVPTEDAEVEPTVGEEI